MIELAGGVLATGAGAAAGSYVGTAALRSVRGESSVWGRSHCDGCGRSLGAFETLPLVSFVAVRGACKTCGAQIDAMHPAAEAVGALTALALWMTTPWPVALLMGAMAAALLAASVIDARSRRLPDALTAVVAIAGLVLAIHRGSEAVWAGLAAAAAAFALLMVVRWTFVRSGRDAGLGFGDVKLICALALWLGVQTPLMVAGAAICALAVLRLSPSADGRIAFGPMIALSGWIAGLMLELRLWPS